MKRMTIEEMKAMVGTEFTYVCGDHDEIKAAIAAFDPKIGFTCLATVEESMLGIDLTPYYDENGNMCLVGDSPDMNPDFLRATMIDMQLIKLLGYTGVGYDKGFGEEKFGGQASCSF
ncbi:MAG: hypothetical protein KAR40_08020 [Candidatus Sabulitectum sp.]|nr:hypothetical protein [Candidatus Sabulitectum sp.]